LVFGVVCYRSPVRFKRRGLDIGHDCRF
jgi:hypothetical protein